MMTKSVSSWLQIHPEISAALSERRPVVALESAVITHGLPRPINLELARRMQAEVRKANALPAITAVIDGVAQLGLTHEELERLSLDDQAVKISRRDYGWAGASGRSVVPCAVERSLDPLIQVKFFSWPQFWPSSVRTLEMYLVPDLGKEATTYLI